MDDDDRQARIRRQPTFPKPPDDQHTGPDVVSEVRKAIEEMQRQIEEGEATRYSIAKALEIAAVMALGSALLDSRTAGQAAQKLLDLIKEAPRSHKDDADIDVDAMTPEEAARAYQDMIRRNSAGD